MPYIVEPGKYDHRALAALGPMIRNQREERERRDLRLLEMQGRAGARAETARHNRALEAAAAAKNQRLSDAAEATATQDAASVSALAAAHPKAGITPGMGVEPAGILAKQAHARKQAATSHQNISTREKEAAARLKQNDIDRENRAAEKMQRDKVAQDEADIITARAKRVLADANVHRDPEKLKEDLNKLVDLARTSESKRVQNIPKMWLGVAIPEEGAPILESVRPAAQVYGEGTGAVEDFVAVKTQDGRMISTKPYTPKQDQGIYIETPDGTVVSTGDTKGMRINKDVNQLRKEVTADPVVKAYTKTSMQMAKMDEVYQDYMTRLQTTGKKPSLIALDQVLVMTLNKILDEESVVRESEFDRTAQQQAWVDYIKGWVPKIQHGGVGLTMANREEIMRTGHLLHQSLKPAYTQKLKFYEGLATRRGYNPEDVLPSDPYSSDPTQPPVQNTGFKVIREVK